MASTSVTFDILARDRASATFNRIGRNTDTLSRRMGSLARTARIALGGFAAFEAAKAIRGIASIGIAYQDSLNVFQSVSRATAEQMDAVANRAKSLGANLKLPTTSAADAAAAMTELAKGGLNVHESMQAALGTLQLATAAQVDGAEAAKIQSAALAQFGLGARQAGHVADLLANAANAAQGEITDMATALTYVGPIARRAGIGIDDTTAAISVLAKNGILAQKAGTGLRGMIVSLQKPTTAGADALKALGVNAFDAQGRFVGLRKVIDQLHGAQGKFTQEGFSNALATAFGRQNLSAITALVGGGTQEFDHFSKAVTRAGGAADVAKARSKGLGGALRGLQSQLETIAISIYQKVAPSLEKMVRGFSRHGLDEIADKAKAAFDRAAPVVEEFARNAAALGQALRPIAERLAKIAGGAILGTLKAAASVMGFLARNADAFRSTLILLVGTYVTYKATVIAVNTAERISNGLKLLAIARTKGLTAAIKVNTSANELNAASQVGAARGVGRLAGAIPGIGTAFVVAMAAADTAYSFIRNQNAKAAESFRRLALSGGRPLADLEGKWLQLSAVVKTQTGVQRAATQALVDAMRQGLENAGVNLDHVGRMFVDVANKAASAAQAVSSFFLSALGGDHTQANINYKQDPGHPGAYVPPSATGSTSGGNGVTTGTQTYSYDAGKDAGKSMADGVAKGLSAAATKAISAAKSMVDKIQQQFQALKDKARQLAQSIAQAVTGAADLSNISQTDSLGAAFAPSVQGIKDFLLAQLKKDREFRRLLKQERARGLSQSLFKQLALAGPDAAGPIVQALAGASRADLRDISRTNRLIGGVGQGLGRNVSQDVYGEALKAQAKLQKDANALLHTLIRTVRDDDHFTEGDARRVGREFRRAIHKEKVVLNLTDVDRHQGRQVETS